MDLSHKINILKIISYNEENFPQTITDLPVY